MRRASHFLKRALLALGFAGALTALAGDGAAIERPPGDNRGRLSHTVARPPAAVGGPEQVTGSIVGWGSQVVLPPWELTNLTAVAAGRSHSLALKADSSIVAWGGNFYRQCELPAPNIGFVAVAAGYGHSLALRADGSIAAWGWNDYGQCNVPAPNSGFVAVAGGYGHSLGLKADGSIAAWGRNYEGQRNVPAPNASFVGVAAGYWHSLGLKADGSIVAWGANGAGQCDVPAPNSGFVAVGGGGYHSLGLRVLAPGDFDGDGDVDLSDFTTFQLCFGGSNNPPAGTCPPGVDADLDGDGDVDLADFLIFQQNFTGSR